MSDTKNLYTPALVDASTAAEIATQVRDLESGLSDYIKKKSRELKIVKIIQELPSVHSAATGDTAIAKSNVCLEDGREVSRVGYASSSQYQTNNVEFLSSLAVAESLVRAISSVESLPSPCRTVHDVPVSSAQECMQISIPVPAPEQKEYKHRNDKLISDKQKEYLTNMAKGKQFNPHEIAVQLKGKSVKELSSADANDVIQWIKNN